MLAMNNAHAGMVQNRVTLKLRVSLNNGVTFKKSVTLPVIKLNHAKYGIWRCGVGLHQTGTLCRGCEIAQASFGKSPGR